MYTDIGFISVITGPMFSEKSGELIKRCMKAKLYGKKEFIAYKPDIDNRFSDKNIVSRVGTAVESIPIPTTLTTELVEEILKESETCDMIAFDEAQFFSKEIIPLVKELADRKKHVLIAGLNMDYRGNAFGYMGNLLAMADEVVKLTAYCNCGRQATHTQRLVNGKPAKSGSTVLVGDSESYEPRCRHCYVSPEKAK